MRKIKHPLSKGILATGEKTLEKWLWYRSFGDVIVFDQKDFTAEEIIAEATKQDFVLTELAPGMLHVTGVEGGTEVIEDEPDDVLARKTVRHKSYAMIDINRSNQGADLEFFGSAIKHRGSVSITIHSGEMVRRSLYEEEPHQGRQTIMKLRMAPDQFAMLVAGMGTACGIPATIEYMEGKRVRYQPPFDHDLQSQVDRGLEEALGDTVRKVLEAEKKIDEILAKKSVTSKADKDEIRRITYHVKRLLTDSLPFLKDQIQDSTTHMVRAASSELEARLRMTIDSLGEDALKERLMAGIGRVADIVPELGCGQDGKTPDE